MSMNLRVSRLLTSVCVFGVVAGSAVFAQDAVVDAVVIDQPAIEAPAAEPAVVAPAVGVLPAFANPPVMTFAVPAPNEPTGYETFDDARLLSELAINQSLHADLHDSVNLLIEVCVKECSAAIADLVAQRDAAQDALDRLNEEIRRRSEIVVVDPEPTPAAVAVVPTEVTADATPPRDFCAALAAKGDFSDCGWAFRQTH